MKNQAIFIIGATASGKTNLALQLSQFLPIEIISVDSAAIYQYLDIGSAKPTPAELKQCRHHLIDIRSVLDIYSAAEFVQDSRRLVQEINAKGKIPVFVGGTMMYYHALINGIHDLPSCFSLRQQLLAEYQEQGLQSLYQQLALLDPVAASQISCNDQQRIIRKLEVCKLLGGTMTEFLKTAPKLRLNDCEIITFVLTPVSREELYQKAEQRFDQMLSHGIVDEVKSVLELYPQLDLRYNSMKSVGYKQVWQFLNGDITYNDMILMAKTATRHLVKKQYTWLRNISGIQVGGGDSLAKMIAAIEDNMIKS